MSTTQALQILSISTALVASGGIATLSLFDVPLLQSQPASRSLPLTRWLFSRGSHIFPQAAIVASAGFAYLAYDALPAGGRTLSNLLRSTSRDGRVGCYVAAAALTLSIAPFTTLVMIPTNFKLIQKNEERGGSRSEKSAKARADAPKSRTAEDSVEGKDDVSELRDLSGPMEKTQSDTSKAEDEEVRALLAKFGKMNGARAVLMGVGGIVGLIGALAF